MKPDNRPQASPCTVRSPTRNPERAAAARSATSTAVTPRGARPAPPEHHALQHQHEQRKAREAEEPDRHARDLDRGEERHPMQRERSRRWPPGARRTAARASPPQRPQTRKRRRRRRSCGRARSSTGGRSSHLPNSPAKPNSSTAPCRATSARRGSRRGRSRWRPGRNGETASSSQLDRAPRRCARIAACRSAPNDQYSRRTTMPTPIPPAKAIAAVRKAPGHPRQGRRRPTSTACCAASTSTRTSSTRPSKAASASATSCSAGT